MLIQQQQRARLGGVVSGAAGQPVTGQLMGAGATPQQAMQPATLPGQMQQGATPQFISDDFNLDSLI